jgi:hypothetical protein
MRTTINRAAQPHTHDPVTRGYFVAYRENEVNHCPGCGRTHWYIGRFSAECGFCATALPLAEATRRGAGTYMRNTRGGARPPNVA